MPFKIRLAQAIQEEHSKALQRQVFHIIGPGALLLIYAILIGSLAVHVVKAPSFFGGGAFDVLIYGILGVAISLSMSKRYIVDKWVDTWELIEKVRRENVAKIEAVMARMEADETEKAKPAKPTAPAAASTNPDPWMRALANPPAQQGALNEQRP